MTYDKQRKYLYTEETLQEVCLGIHSMCVGSESKYFNGHTNITDSNFLVFGVKGLMDTNRRLKDCTARHLRYSHKLNRYACVLFCAQAYFLNAALQIVKPLCKRFKQTGSLAALSKIIGNAFLAQSH